MRAWVQCGRYDRRSCWFAMDRLFEAGALDVYTVPIGMKKSRPGTLIKVMCRESDKEKIIETVFKYTTTIGIRENMMKRYVLDRHIETVETEYGPVHCKLSTGYGVTRKNMSMMILRVLRRRKAFPLKRRVGY